MLSLGKTPKGCFTSKWFAKYLLDSKKRKVTLLSFYFAWTIMLCICHTTPTQNDPVCNLFSGWVTMTGKLLGPTLL